jgi:hypothetical protein
MPFRRAVGWARTYIQKQAKYKARGCAWVGWGFEAPKKLPYFGFSFALEGLCGRLCLRKDLIQGKQSDALNCS